MKKVELNGGCYVTIDDEDYDIISKHKWYVHWCGRRKKYKYAIANIRLSDGRRTTIKMHRVIMDAPSGYEIDHIDGDGLNNQRLNLRVVNKNQNMMNMAVHRDNQTGYKGVSKSRGVGRYRARIRVYGKEICLGCYKTAIDAHHAYTKAANQYFGEYANPGE